MRAIALLYHDVVEPGAFDASGFAGAGADRYKLSIRDFEAHLAAIASVVAGRPRTALELLDGAAGPAPCLLTFDDGGRSAYTHVADRLERRGWHGHFLVTTDYLGAPGFVTAAELRDLRARGHVIGTHSCSHPARLSTWHPARVREEWRGSIAVLSDLLGEPIVVASVPAGSYSRMVGEAAAQAGTRVLFTSEPTTCCRAVGDCLIVGRFAFRTHSPSALAARIVRAEVAPRAIQWLGWKTRALARAIGGQTYLRLRTAWLER